MDGAEAVALVTDSLNTHMPACLNQAFEPEGARRIAAKVEWHYTPKHGSWLNMAEIELSAQGRQCLAGRVGSRADLGRRVGAWERDRNER
jgi:hypothetical protein